MSDQSWGGGGPGPPLVAPSTLASTTGTTSAWAGGAVMAGKPHKQRTFAEIIAEQKKNRNILEIKFTKITKADSKRYLFDSTT